MRRSAARILATHVGRLQRPEDLTQAMEAHPRGRPTDDEFAGRLRATVADVVREQAEAGVDIVCDGEFGKLGWNTYLHGRLGGHEIVAAKPGETQRHSRDREAFAQFYRELESGGSYYYRSPGRAAPPGMRWACTGPVTYIGQDALRQDLACLRAAVDAAKVEEAFVPSTSPIRPGMNAHYPSEEAYYEAVGEAMRTEYRAIVDAGFILQIDDPHLPDMWESQSPRLDMPAYLKQAAKFVDLINHALRGIPEDRVRYHICWGSWHGAHAFDLPLRDIVDILLTVKAQGYAIEAANARHEHEWQVWQDVKLPAGKVLIPGVVAHATNGIEHPELVAWRIRNFAGVVGRENVIAGTDCGLGYRVHPQIAWAKLKTLAEGARLASRALW
ncbi:MAG TPA: cobalamin-independent methionine synthase II family protein [Stellaceae bacterium]|nr:cobalamin-independent methionine synthase II family protein [Stellaceae bacterium]